MMLRKNLKAFVLTVAVFAVAAVGVQASTANDTPQTELEEKILKKINGMPYYSVFDHIAFRVDDGTVYLTGDVYRGTNKSVAENIIKKLDGVDEVVNDIEVLPASPYDDRLRLQVYRSLFNSGGLSRYLYTNRPSIRIIVKRGRVTLVGFVANKGDKNLARISANTVPGVFKVTDDLVIDSGKSM